MSIRKVNYVNMCNSNAEICRIEEDKGKPKERDLESDRERETKM